MNATSITHNDIWFMLSGAGVTIALTFWAVLIGTVLGVGFGLIRAEGNRAVSVILGFVLDIFRSVPLLIQLILLNSAASMFRLGLPPFKIACLTLAIYTAAFFTEIVRSGFLAVPPTTRRAARSLGMTYFQDLREIVFPIAARVVLPNWIGLTLAVMKDTSLVLWLGIAELLKTSQSVVVRTQEPMTVLLLVGVIYFLMSYPISRVGLMLEKRWTKHD